MTMLTLDVQELEESLDDELLCGVDHDALDFDDYVPPACGIVAVARLVACDNVILLCRPLALEADGIITGPGDESCSVCGRNCSRVVWF